MKTSTQIRSPNGSVIEFVRKTQQIKPALNRRASLQIVAAKGKKMMRYGGRPQPDMPQLPPTPPVDPENAEFVIFARSKKLPQWFPVSITKGGTGANLLVKSMETHWGRTLYSNTLISSIAKSVHAEKDIIIKQIKATNAMMKDTKEFEFGFKIRDKSDPAAWLYPTADLILLPEPQDLMGTVFENMSAFFGSIGK